MKATRPLPRWRAKVLELRQRATDAHEALEGFSGDPERVPEDRALWDQLCRVANQTERAATEAERAAVEKPKRKEIEREKKLTREAKDAKSGTRLETTKDAATLARVAQCVVCEATAVLRGADAADELRRLGWGARRDTSKPGWPRVWWCPECWQPPLLEGPHAAWEPPPKLLKLGAMRSHAKARGRLERELVALAAVDRPKAEAALLRLIYGAESRVKARRWRTFAARLGIEPVKVAPKARKRVDPDRGRGAETVPVPVPVPASLVAWHASHERTRCGVPPLSSDAREKLRKHLARRGVELAVEPPPPLAYDACRGCGYVDGAPELGEPCSRVEARAEGYT
jgi:hypothetical protein